MNAHAADAVFEGREAARLQREWEKANVTLDGFTKDPQPWRNDGGERRVPIYDHVFSPPRLVRVVGWVNCLSPYTRHNPHRFLSPDIKRVRMCPDCKFRNATAYHRFRAD